MNEELNTIWKLYSESKHNATDNLIKEGSDYDLYHKTFTDAVKTAVDIAKKRGYEVNEDDWFNKVSTGPRKPVEGDTNKYHIELLKDGKPAKKMLHFQVYGMKNSYELNVYVESKHDSEKNDDIWQVYAESRSTDVITEARGALLDTYPEDDYTVYERVRSLEEARGFVSTFFSDKRMSRDLRREFNKLLKADFYRWTDGKTHEDGIDPNEYEAIDNYLSKINRDMRLKDKENYFSFGYPLVTTKGDFNVDVTYVIPKASAEGNIDFNTINRKEWYSAIEEWVNNIEPLYIIGIKDPKKVAETESNLDDY